MAAEYWEVFRELDSEFVLLGPVMGWENRWEGKVRSC